MRLIYRGKDSLKAFGLLFLAFSAFFLYDAWRDRAPGTDTWIKLAGGSVLLLVGVWLSVHSLRTRVVLSDESVSYTDVSGSRSLPLNKISCRREYEYVDDGVLCSYLELVSNDAGLPSLKIPKHEFNFDAAFWGWMRRIPESDRLGHAIHTPETRRAWRT